MATPAPAAPGQTPVAGADLTPLQHACMLGRQSDEPLGGIEPLVYWELRGARLDTDALQRAVDAVHAHAVLRCRFTHDPVAIHDDDCPPPQVTRHDVAADPDGLRAGIRESLMTDAVDITAGRVWALAVSDAGDDCMLHVVFSAAALDEAATGAVLHDLAAAYRGTDSGIDRVPAVAAVHDELAHTRARASVDPDAVEVLPGPDLPDIKGAEGGASQTVRHVLSAQTWSALERWALEHSASTAALTLAIYDGVLRRWSQRQDFTVNATHLTEGPQGPVAQRAVPRAHQAVVHDTFPGQVAASAESLQAGVPAYSDFVAHMQGADVTPEASRVAFAFLADEPVCTDVVRETFGAPQTWGQAPHTALGLRLTRIDEGQVEVAVDVRTAVLSESIAQAVLDLFIEHVDDVITTGAPRAELPRSQRVIRDEANASAPMPPRVLTDGLREQARLRPDAIAIQESKTGATITYAELDARACAIGAAIAQDAEPGGLVAVQMPRGISQIATILGVLYAGCAYLPIGQGAPQARLERIEKRAQWAGLYTDEPALPEGIEPLVEPIHREPTNLAYVIFTSGSTGEPKGVSIAHGPAMNTLDDLQQRHGLCPDDTVLGVSGIDFDLSVHDLFGTFSAGARLIMTDESQTREPFSWAEVVRSEGVTVWNSVPMLLEMLLATAQNLESLRLFYISGDRIPLDLPARSRKCSPGSTFVAMGGATEASIWSNQHVIRDASDQPAHWTSVPYGLPLTGQKYRVADASGKDAPDGCIGELMIGGAGVAEGYYKDPERTERSYLTDADGVRWYRTGDLGTWSEGRMFFVGRLDTQVKIRGHRVECGEVQARLEEHPGVAQATVVPIRDRSALGAAFIPAEGQPMPSEEELAERLSAQLPWYMVPSTVIPLESFPMTGNGKVDKAKVTQELEQPAGAVQTVDAGDESEYAAVCAVWSELLGCVIEEDSNFFGLGGDSLMATRMCVTLQDRGVDATLPDLFTSPEAAAFAEACRTRKEAALVPSSDEEAESAESAVRTWREQARDEHVSLGDLGLTEWCRWMWRYQLGDRVAPGAQIADGDDFFALGGDSLTVARMCADLAESGVKVQVADVFRNSRLADFVTCCTVTGGTDPVQEAPSDRFPLTALQQAFAMGSDGIPDVVRATPGVSVVLSTDDDAIAARWEDALTALVRRHDVLRLVRSEGRYQRVLDDATPEIVEVTEPMDDAGFRDMLRGIEVDPSEGPAVRGYVRADRRGELGLVFSYLSMDSTSVGEVLKDLAALAADPATAEGVDPGHVGIEAFRRYAVAAANGEDSATPATGGGPATPPPPGPRLPIGPIPAEPVSFTSRSRVLDRDEVRTLQEAARQHNVSLNSILLYAFGAAVAAANDQDRLTVNIPAAARPWGAFDAVGQFSELALCECGEDMGLEGVHEALGKALSEASAVPFGGSHEGEQYPVVFTSLLGSALGETLADGQVEKVWLHTRTPAVLIECQVTPLPDDAVEARWDMPVGIIDPAFVEKAFAEFTERIRKALAGEPMESGQVRPRAPRQQARPRPQLLDPMPGSQTPDFPKAHVVFFPHAGASPRSLTHLAGPLEAMKVSAVTYPCRDHLMHAEAMTDIPTIAETVADQVQAADGDSQEPLVLAGHSFGSCVAYETAALLQHRYEQTGNRRRVILIASGQNCPRPGEGPEIERQMSDEEIIADIVRQNPSTAAAWEQPALRDLFLPPVRADYRCLEQYEASGAVVEEIHVAVGVDDVAVTHETLPGWQAFSRSEITINTFPGGHMYLDNPDTHLAELVIKALDT